MVMNKYKAIFYLSNRQTDIVVKWCKVLTFILQLPVSQRYVPFPLPMLRVIYWPSAIFLSVGIIAI